MKVEDLNAIHQNPANWHLYFFYFAPQDPRMVVKKRIGSLGWTINLARPLAIPFILVLCAGALGATRVLKNLNSPETVKWGGLILLIIGIFALCSWMANPRRFVK